MNLPASGKVTYWAWPTKMLLAMKITAFFLIVCLHVSATTLSQKITLNEKNAPLSRIFQVIQTKSGLSVIYDNNLLKNTQLVSIQIRDASVSEVLNHVLKDQQLEFEIEDRIIFIKPAKVKKIADTGNQAPSLLRFQTVQGSVRGDKGIPLEGASVIIKNKDLERGTATNNKGTFLLQDLPEGTYTIEITIIGYKKYERPIVVDNATRALHITLTPAISSLDEAVVIGYGTQRAGNITGSIARVSSRDIAEVPVAGLEKALQGRAAGVQVTQTSGQPGGSVSVRIRGISSISAGNEPLYVIDGVPFYNWSTTFNMGPAGIYGTGVLQNAMSAINPNDIESIEILKDAVATSIYGARAANGVVIVTTKKGKAGRAKIELDAYYGQQQVIKKLDVLNAVQYAELINESRVNGFKDLGSPASPPATVKPIPDLANPAALGEGTNWQRHIFTDAPIQNYQLTLSGGTDKTSYTFSGNYFNQEGIVSGSSYKRFGGRVNLEQQATDRLKVGANITVNNAMNVINRATGIEQQGGVIYLALFQTPHIPVYNSSGRFARPNFSNGFAVLDNPVASAVDYYHTINTTRSINSLYGELKLTKDLSFRTSIGFDAMYLKNNIYIPTTGGPTPPSSGAGFAFASQEVAWMNDNILTYNKKIGRHHFTAVAGTTIQSSHFERMISRVFNFPNDLVITTNGGQTDLTNSFMEEWRMVSYLARFTYNYDDRYLVTLAGRTDGSSRFGPGNRFGQFPSVSVGWRLSRERFLEDASWIDDLKLRASYGLTGNSEITNTTSSFANYPYLGKIDPANYSFGGVPVNGLSPGSISNDNLKWESTRQFDAGIDLTLWRGRVNVTADYYIKTTRDMLVGNVPLPYTTGFGSAIQNIGSMENQGYELTLRTANLVSKLKWNTDLTFSTNRNKVTSLGAQGQKILLGTSIGVNTGASSITMVGEPVGSFYGFITDGIFQDQATINKSAAQPGAKPGDVKFKDLNNDRVIDAKDQTIIGNPQPDFIYSINNHWLYRDFDLTVFIQGVHGNEIANITRLKMEQMLGYYNGAKSALGRWRSADQPGNGSMPRATAIDPNNNSRFSSRWIEDGSFLRFKAITLGYILPKSVLKKIQLQRVRIYVSAQNLFTITNYTGFDPEMSRTSADGDNALRAGYDDSNYPVARSWMAGLNIQF